MILAGIVALKTWPIKTLNTKKDILNSELIIVAKKNPLYLSVKVFSTKALTGDTIFTSPTRDETAVLRCHPSHAKV